MIFLVILNLFEINLYVYLTNICVNTTMLLLSVLNLYYNNNNIYYYYNIIIIDGHGEALMETLKTKLTTS